MALSKAAAMRQARNESHMRRQGTGWCITTWDEDVKMWREGCSEHHFLAAQTYLREWREERAAELMAD